MNFHRAYRTATAIGLLMSVSLFSAHAQTTSSKTKEEEEKARQEQAGTIILNEVVVLSAKDQLKQAPGVSNISSEDIAKTPPTNDISEIVRKMPGINLTGNSATGVRGNNRQIDIRGMGPENTLILIDGKPVLSRNSVRYSMNGERDTRGDSNWVPAEAIERIEVIRGPAAARYGSGSSGGVINIITKRPDKATYSVNTYFNVPEHSDEGGSKRANLLASGPINDFLSYRFFAGVGKQDPDKLDINGEEDAGTTAPAGREGVINKDLKGLLSWEINESHRLDFEATWSRQSNQFAGDTQYGGTANEIIKELGRRGDETNRMTRSTLAATHYGQYDFGTSESSIQWEHTVNRRLREGLAGAGEGTISTGGDGPTWGTATLDNIYAKSEFNIPLSFHFDQKLTLGVDYRGEMMDDPISITQTIGNGIDFGIPGNPADRDPKSSAHMFGLYAEDNIMITDAFILTPGLRLDYHDKFGLNWSPSLNASYNFTPEITLKAGIARAFKAPNLFQLNPNYVYTSRGNGCRAPYYRMQCYIIGNPDLDAEVSVNKEIGINYTDDAGWNAGITYFHNDYKNKIITGYEPVWFQYPDRPTEGSRLYRWENGGPATIAGLEANLAVPVFEKLTWTTNATKMIESKDSNGQPLSLVPEYTINTALNYQATEELGFTVSATHYGKIKPLTWNSTSGQPREGEDLNARKAYTIVNASLDFRLNDNLKVAAGVNNVFDERLFRTGDGANTFNEPGRAYFLSLSGSF